MDTDSRLLRDMRKTILQMVYNAKEGHIPSAFSILEILYVLYRDCLKIDPKNPRAPDRDYFLLSKGHAGAGLYAVLAQFGFFEREELLNYCRPGSRFGGHPDALKVPGVEVCAGSLGHGIAMGVGVAVGLKHQGLPGRVVVLVGDGEMEEGSFWESLMLAKNLGLGNLTVIADGNGSQKYSHKFDYRKIAEGFDWQAVEVDGHDLSQLSRTLKPLVRGERNAPAFVFARTRKGEGVARFVGEHAWHRRTPTDAELNEILKELT